jgi:glycosyltransferase involved in cell wall biosynthesis
LRPVKDGALLVRAFARAAAAHPGARLTLVGGGEVPEVPLGVHVARRARLAWDALPAVYAEAGVFAIASRHEAFCLAALEAMACGLPLAGTAVGLLPEVCAGECPAGLCAEAGDEIALAAALEALLCDGALRERLGRNGRQLATERYAWRTVVAQYETLYQGAAA